MATLLRQRCLDPSQTGIADPFRSTRRPNIAPQMHMVE